MLVGLAVIISHRPGAALHPARQGDAGLSDNMALAEVTGIDTRRVVASPGRLPAGWALAGILYAVGDRLDQPEFRRHHPAQPVRRRDPRRHRQRLWRARRRHRHRAVAGMVDPVRQPALEAGGGLRHPDPDAAGAAARHLRPRARRGHDPPPRPPSRPRISISGSASGWLPASTASSPSGCRSMSASPGC